MMHTAFHIKVFQLVLLPAQNLDVQIGHIFLQDTFFTN